MAVCVCVCWGYVYVCTIFHMNIPYEYVHMGSDVPDGLTLNSSSLKQKKKKYRGQSNSVD